MQSLSAQFLTFCRSKPADEAYDYDDQRHCAAGQFVTEMGLPYAQCANAIERKFLFELGDEPHTFGALADRLAA